MNSFKVFIFICLIYQTLAGGPGIQSSSTPPASLAPPLPICIKCTDVFRDGVAPTHNDCDPGSTQKVILTVYFTNTLGTVSGACTDPVLGITEAAVDNSVADYSTDIPVQFDTAP